MPIYEHLRTYLDYGFKCQILLSSIIGKGISNSILPHEGKNYYKNRRSNRSLQEICRPSLERW